MRLLIIWGWGNVINPVKSGLYLAVLNGYWSVLRFQIYAEYSESEHSEWQYPIIQLILSLNMVFILISGLSFLRFGVRLLLWMVNYVLFIRRNIRMRIFLMLF